MHTAYFAQARNHCTGCHDRENSPKFVYDKYWKKIEHGESPAKSQSDRQTSRLGGTP